MSKALAWGFLLWVVIAGYFDPTIPFFCFLGYAMAKIDQHYNESRIYNLVWGFLDF